MASVVAGDARTARGLLDSGATNSVELIKLYMARIYKYDTYLQSVISLADP